MRSHSFLSVTALFFLGACATSSQRASVGSEDQSELVEETPSELEISLTSSDRSASEIQADRDAQNSFPLVHNEFVEKWIQYFTATPRGRKTFEKWLARKQRYASLIRDTVREDGLPEDLIYLAMIESGFNPRAHSHAGAAGVWQFMPYTGRNYGLRLDHWYDERRDIVKATHAAATYLKELHQVFGSWYLAAASYNAGEGRTLRIVREYKTRNYWELIRTRGAYRNETRNYVPKIIAAAMISKDPEKYGFVGIEKESPLVWEEVMVKGGVSLRDIARGISTDYSELSLLNPELRRGLTPPNKDEWRVRVPPEKKDKLLAVRDSLESHRSGHFINHRISSGETLSHIGERYGVRVSTIMDLNNISSARRVRAGSTIKIPVDYRNSGRGSRSSARSSNNDVASGSVYTVRRGDTLTEIAERHGMGLSELLRLNGLQRSRIYPGQKLKVRDQGDSSGPTSYRVRRGDNLNDIAAKHGITLSQLRSLNGISGSRIYPDQVLKVSGGSRSPASRSWRTHKVRSGESLWSLARKHGVSVRELSSKNGLSRQASLQIGQQIKVPQ